MSDAQDRIAHLAAEARSRADVAGTQAAWQEGRAHGLREAAAITAAATDAGTQALRGDLRDYVESLDEQAAIANAVSQRLADGGGVRSAGFCEGRCRTLRQVAEELRSLLGFVGGEEAES